MILSQQKRADEARQKAEWDDVTNKMTRELTLKERAINRNIRKVCKQHLILILKSYFLTFHLRPMLVSVKKTKK